MKSNYTLIGVISVVVLAAIIYGFTLAGLPPDARGMRFDSTRVSDLRTITYRIDSYVALNYRLPYTLEELKKDNGLFSITDPETEKVYEYSVTGDESYKLCATFSTDSEEAQQSIESDTLPTFSTSYQSDFIYKKGYQCFDFTENIRSRYPTPYTPPFFYITPTPYISPVPVTRFPTPAPTRTFVR